MPDRWRVITVQNRARTTIWQCQVEPAKNESKVSHEH